MTPSLYAHKGFGAIGYSSAALTAAVTYDPPYRGFHCNVAGTIVLVGLDDSSSPALTILAGVTYGNLPFKRITTLAGGAEVIGLK